MTVKAGSFADRFVQGSDAQIQPLHTRFFPRLYHNRSYLFHTTPQSSGSRVYPGSESNLSNASLSTNILPPIVFPGRYFFTKLRIFFLLAFRYSFCMSVIVKYFLFNVFSMSFDLLWVCLIICWFLCIFLRKKRNRVCRQAHPVSTVDF